MEDILNAIASRDVGQIVAYVFVGFVAFALKRFVHLDMEKKHRDALAAAIETGVDLMLSDRPDTSDVQTPDDVVKYVRRSTPDAIKGLKAGNSVIVDKVRARAAKVVRGN